MFRRTPLSPTRTTRTIRTALVGTAALGLAVGALTGVTATAQAAPVTTARGTVFDEASQAAAAARAEAARKHRDPVARAEAEQAIRDRVVEKALAQVGDDYGAGGDGPNVFDCSGLVVYAYRSVGIDLEHYSYAQYKATERISLKDAVPGDLAFYFENGAHHVSIYIGDGKVVQASDYGIGVIKGTVKDSPWTREHFTGMGRVKIPG